MRRSPTAIAALLAATLLSGCGADSVRDSVDPVAEAATTTQRQTSARMTIVSQGEVSGQPLTTKGSGVIQFRPVKAKLSITASAAGQDAVIDEIMDGAKLYMRLPAEARQGMPKGKSWILLDLDRFSGGALGSAMSGSQDPAASLKLLQGLSDAKAIGKETIDGVETTHYHGIVDYAKIAKSGPPALRKVAEQSLKFTARPQVPVDAWVDAQKRVRRERILVATKPLGDSPAQNQTITMDFTDFGVDASDIAAPDAASVYDVTDEASAAMKEAIK